ncbi:RNA polymerase II C-terminal domain phosphatase-like 3 [Iris pallida]|uniref:RNA polymerase II C-terminal domain phosphatase-like 3 n=1 Tax=Iris pallida TaxID=29817 RepID=A0AAX6EF53_IRIPA|nr:RNA polymerase II C-terminal domain phosphatase-like 3 [Iris pallida]
MGLLVDNSRKNKAGDKPLPDENNLKRQRTGQSRDIQATTGSGGWIENGPPLAPQMGNGVRPNENMAMDIRKPGNGVNVNINSNGSNGGFVPNPATSSVPAVSLPSLLKEIAVNPAMLLQLVKKEQQRLAAEAQQKTANPQLASDAQQKSGNLAVNELPGAVPLVNDASTKPVEVMEPQMPPQNVAMNSQNDVGRIRMKPRDPRRILHTNMVQKSDSLGSKPPKTSGAPVSDMQISKDHMTVREQGVQAQTTGLPSQSPVLPDIARQFTDGLKNVADIVSTSQLTATPPAEPQTFLNQFQVELVIFQSNLRLFLKYLVRDGEQVSPHSQLIRGEM